MGKKIFLASNPKGITESDKTILVNKAFQKYNTIFPCYHTSIAKSFICEDNGTKLFYYNDIQGSTHLSILS